jgi:hypothetical protein
MRNYLTAQANSALEYAQATAPVLSGEYRDSLAVEADDQENGDPGVALVAGTDHWSYIEFGSIHNDPLHILGEAVANTVGRENYTDAEGNPLP